MLLPVWELQVYGMPLADLPTPGMETWSPKAPHTETNVPAQKHFAEHPSTAQAPAPHTEEVE